jgi:hypothetical protein
VYCLIDDLSKLYRHDGPISAQKQILHQTLGEEHLQICNLYNASNLIRAKLRRVKSLIILDNVDQIEQLEKLAVSREWLGAGSRIVIVSRDEHILKEYGVDVVYKVPLLNHTDSLRLFSQKAFKLDHVMSSYDKLAFDILWFANGLPLAIKVLGSFLFGRDINEWKSALARLRESPNKDIMDVLRLSFEGLEKLEKEIFLDIACFFNRRNEDYVKNVLNCRGFHADIGLRVLVDKSLLSISEEDNIIKMHNLLLDMGRKIVEENSSQESRKWSRVWLHEQFHNVMLKNVVNYIVLEIENLSTF